MGDLWFSSPSRLNHTVRPKCRSTCTPQISNPPTLLHSSLQPCPSLSSRKRTWTSVVPAFWRYALSATELVRYRVFPKSKQNVFSCVSGFVTQSRVRPHSACHNSHQALSSRPRPSTCRLWTILLYVPDHCSWINHPKHVICFVPKVTVGSLR